MQTSWALGLMTAMSFLAPAGRAAMIFDATGTTDFGNTLSGTVTIDTVLGMVTSMNLTSAGGSSSFNGTFSFSSQGTISGNVDFRSPGPVPFIDIILPVSSLVGYSGGNLVSGRPNGSVILGVSVNTYFTSGSLTAETPEPASAVLIGASLLGLAALRRRRTVRS